MRWSGRELDCDVWPTQPCSVRHYPIALSAEQIFRRDSTRAFAHHSITASPRNSNDGGTSIADHFRVFKFTVAENLVDLQTNRFCSPYFVHESARSPRSSQSLSTQGLNNRQESVFLDFIMQQRCILPSDRQSNDIADKFDCYDELGWDQACA
jgi:hypothetical protein